jgi:hypothetical protein
MSHENLEKAIRSEQLTAELLAVAAMLSEDVTFNLIRSTGLTIFPGK